ncbi:hypothetical protein KC19_8G005200, partial [Ceratodon purpureus]
ESQSPIVNAEKGVANPFPDISEEVRQELEETEEVVVEPPKRVRFSEGTTTIAENRPLQVDEYDILQDIKDQKANATIGQLLHDNANYQKQLREACIRPRRRRIRLPPVAVNFSAIEDYGAPEIAVEIDGCMIQNVPVDGGSGVNLMLETTANDLGFTVFEPTIQVLRMADQSRVVPLGKLTGIPTKIGETTYPLNYVILKIETGRPFPLLLGRPWLYLAEVRVDWGKKEFTFGNPPFPLPWKHEEHMGETSDTDGYTSDWSDQREEDSSMTYLVRNFKDQTEADYGFPEAVEEQGSELPESVIDGADRVKAVVSPEDYEAVEVQPGKKFHLGKNLSAAERVEYIKLLSEFSDVFAW